MNSESNQNPGPGTYKPKSGFTHKNNPNIKFGKYGKRDLIDESNKNPGPGTYELRKDFDSYQKNRVPLGKKFELVCKKDVPGPGNYNPDIDHYSTKMNCFIGGKFGKDKKNIDVKNEKPAPDAYF